MNKKYLPLSILIVWPLMALGISFIFKINTLWSTILFLDIPSLYLSFVVKNSVLKAFIFSLITGIPLITIVDCNPSHPLEVRRQRAVLTCVQQHGFFI